MPAEGLQNQPQSADTLEKLVPTCVRRIRKHLGNELPRLALVLGSGFDGVRRRLEIRQKLAYSELPGFPAARVPGHSGELLLASLAGVPILACCGRAHYYEGLDMTQVTFPVRVLAAIGISDLILTNAAGGINPRFRPGDFMAFSDHINFTGVNPLRGLPLAEGKAFVDLTEAYSADLREILRSVAKHSRIKLREGVYLGVSGPSYETPAEIRAFARLGADAVGMSTIPEVLMARYCGLRVAAISCITNCAAGLSQERLSHREVLAMGRKSAEKAGQLLENFVRACVNTPKAG